MPSDSNLTEWQSRIEDLRAKGFIDMHTRFVYVSLNVYNVATVHPNPNPNPNPNQVARELEDPYTAELGSSANRLQAAAMHSDFNQRLLTFHRNGRGLPLRSSAAQSA